MRGQTRSFSDYTITYEIVTQGWVVDEGGRTHDYFCSINLAPGLLYLRRGRSWLAGSQENHIRSCRRSCPGWALSTNCERRGGTIK